MFETLKQKIFGGGPLKPPATPRGNIVDQLTDSAFEDYKALPLQLGEEDLLRAATEDPNNDVPRLVYADRLDELARIFSDRPSSAILQAHAILIRGLIAEKPRETLSIEISEGFNSIKDHQVQILRAFSTRVFRHVSGHELPAELHNERTVCPYDRGFYSWIKLRTAEAVRSFRLMADLLPRDELIIVEYNDPLDDLKELLESPGGPYISFINASDAELQFLFNGTSYPHVKTLRLNLQLFDAAQSEAFAEFASTNCLPSLDTFIFQPHSRPDEGQLQPCTPTFPRRALELSWNALALDFLERRALSPGMPDLEEIRVIQGHGFKDSTGFRHYSDNRANPTELLVAVLERAGRMGRLSSVNTLVIDHRWVNDEMFNSFCDIEWAPKHISIKGDAYTLAEPLIRFIEHCRPISLACSPMWGSLRVPSAHLADLRNALENAPLERLILGQIVTEEETGFDAFLHWNKLRSLRQVALGPISDHAARNLVITQNVPEQGILSFDPQHVTDETQSMLKDIFGERIRFGRILK